MTAHLIVCAVYDDQQQAYANPFYVPTAGVAMRSFSDEVNRPESPMHQHPEDYSLHQLGTFNADTGEFRNEPSRLCLARDVKTKAH